MADVRITSIADPFSDDDPELGEAFLDVLLRADSMGLIGTDVRRLDRESLVNVARAMSEHGIGQGLAVEAMHVGSLSRERLLTLLRRWREALEESPIPATELPALLELLGLEPVAELLGTSPSSLRRYVAGQRVVPDEISARAHLLAGVVGDLRGAYNEIGVRRWFSRERSALAGRSPRDALGQGWDPDSAEALEVRELAHSLVMSPAT
jgi:hypothetical protein